MIRRDFSEVLDIEFECFDYPWFEADFVRCLRGRNCIGMVADEVSVGADGEIGGQVLGYMVYELFGDKLELLNLAVRTDRWRTGVGRLLVEKLVGKLSPHRRTRIVADVLDANLRAQLFFRAAGFRADGVIRDCFDNPSDCFGNHSLDALRFIYRVQSGAGSQPAAPRIGDRSSSTTES
jgi:ribosomal-protein-alanine N-acetyltransferase